MNETEKAKGVLLEFIREMHDWEVEAHNFYVSNREEISMKEAYQVINRSLDLVFEKYLSAKVRRNTRHGTISHPPDYNPQTEVVVSVTARSGTRIDIETLARLKSESLQFLYVMLKEEAGWKIDHKKCFHTFKGKWESAIL